MLENNYRKDLESIDKGWMTGPHIISQLSTCSFDRTGRHQIDVDGIPFECLYLKNPHASERALYVSLGGGGRKGKMYPTFFRWKYLKYFTGDYLAIDDPTYWRYPEFKGVRWYHGQDGLEYYQRMVKIIQKFQDQHNIPTDKIYFLGSSGGGVAAIKLANLIAGTTAIAFSPQFRFSHWKESVTNQFLSEGVDLKAQEIDGLNVDCTNPQSRYFIVENLASEEDWDEQYRHFSLKHNFEPKIGIQKVQDNIWTWNHWTPSYEPHSSNPEKLEVSLIISILNGSVDISSKVGERDLGWYFSEQLSDKWMSYTTIQGLKKAQPSVTAKNNDNDLQILPHLIDVATITCANFDFIDRIEPEKKRPRVRLMIKGFNVNTFFELSMIGGRFWMRLIAKEPSDKLLEILSKSEEKTSASFVNKMDRESFVYLKKELVIYYLGKGVEEFVTSVYNACLTSHAQMEG